MLQLMNIANAAVKRVVASMFANIIEAVLIIMIIQANCIDSNSSALILFLYFQNSNILFCFYHRLKGLLSVLRGQYNALCSRV